MDEVLQKPVAKVFFPNLDGLRTIAFLFVFIQHAFWGSFEHLNISDSSIVSKVIYEIANGATGVSIFFVLSGFLITYLLLKEKLVQGRIHVGYFYVRRILRIWPLYFAVIIFAFIIYPFLKAHLGIDSNLASKPIYYFTFLSNFDVINIQRFHLGSDAMMGSITWSVAIEEQFYLIWPLLFLIVPQRGYLSIFLSVIVICLLFRFVHKDDKVVMYFHSLSVCADLAIGGLCAYFSIFSTRFIDFFSRLNKKIILGVYLLGFAWMLYGGSMGPIAGVLFYRLITTCFFAFVILEQNFSSHSFYAFSRSKLLTFWGKYTYGLYLLHPIALLLLDILLRMSSVSYKNAFLSYFTVGLAALGLSLLMSYLSYEYYEKWFLRFKDAFSFVQKQTKILEQMDSPLQEKTTIRQDQVA